jgi:hypothetical protein
VLQQAQLLSPEDQARLAHELLVMVRQYIESQKYDEPEKARLSILEFQGMDQESWKDVNVRDYINQERAAWEKSIYPGEEPIYLFLG